LIIFKQSSLSPWVTSKILARDQTGQASKPA
jgi:hypothetical protein